MPNKPEFHCVEQNTPGSKDSSFQATANGNPHPPANKTETRKAHHKTRTTLGKNRRGSTKTRPAGVYEISRAEWHRMSQVAKSPTNENHPTRERSPCPQKAHPLAMFRSRLICPPQLTLAMPHSARMTCCTR